MTLVTLRPNGTVGNTGTVFGPGGTTADGALSDDSATTFLRLQYGEQVEVNLTDLTLPGGAIVTRAAIRVRVKVFTAPNPTSIEAGVGGVTSVNRDLSVTWSGGTIVQVGPAIVSGQADSPYFDGRTLTDAMMDAATLIVGGTNALASAQLFEGYLDVTYVTKPVVTVNAPSGTITTTNRPAVTWTNTLDPDGGPQDGATVKIFTAAQYGAGGFDPATSTPYASGLAGGASTSVTCETVLPDGAYRAYVQMDQTPNGVEFLSDWAFSSFVISVALPAEPAMTLTPDPDNGRIQIDLVANSGTATTDTFELQRSIDGFEWVPVRSTVGNDGTMAINATSLTAYDYEVPNGVIVGYRARAIHYYGSARAASRWTSQSPTNLVTNPSFEFGTAGWTAGSGVTLAGDNFATAGSACAKMTGTITNNDGSIFSPPLDVSFSPGDPVSARADINVQNAFNGNPGRIIAQFDDGSDAWVLTPVSGLNISAGVGLKEVSIENAIAPAGATRARLRLAGDTVGTDTFDWRVDAVIASKSAVVPEYFDGDSQWGIWQGARHDSASKMAMRTSWASETWWLKHPNIPALNVPLVMRSNPTVTRAARRGIFQAVGASLPIVISDTRGGPQGTIVVEVPDAATLGALDALLDTSATYLLQGPPSSDEPDRYVRIGDVDGTRQVDKARSHYRDITLPWVEVAPPAGALS